jgi:hypothetical protein
VSPVKTESKGFKDSRGRGSKDSSEVLGWPLHLTSGRIEIISLIKRKASPKGGGFSPNDRVGDKYENRAR